MISYDKPLIIKQWKLYELILAYHYIHYPDAPWCWNIYLNDWVILVVNVGKYSIHLGKFHHDRTLFSLTGIMVRIREIIPKWPNYSG